MTTTSSVGVTENSPTKEVATYQFSEDAIQKQLERTVLNDSLGQEIMAGYGASVGFSRPANSTAYGAGDVIGPVSGTSAMSFAVGPASGGEVIIQSLSLEIDDNTIASGEGVYRLHFYSSAPASAFTDNAAFDLPSGDRIAYLGYVDLPTVVDLGSTIYVESNNINKQVTLASGALFAYLVTNTGFTPTSGRPYKVTVHTKRPFA